MPHHWEYNMRPTSVWQPRGGGSKLKTKVRFDKSGDAWHDIYGENREDEAAILNVILTAKQMNRAVGIYTTWPTFGGTGVYGVVLW